MDKIFIDVNIPIYAAGNDHPLKSPCQKIIQSIAEEKIEAFTDAEIFQEIFYRFASIKQPSVGLKIFDHFFKLMKGHILPLREEEISVTGKLIKDYPAIKPRDLLHVSVMLSNNIQLIYTADRDFDQIKEINRIDPLMVRETS